MSGAKHFALLTTDQRKSLAKAKQLIAVVVRFLQANHKASQALSLAEQSLDLFEKVLGKEHPDYAASLNNLAALYRSMGDYAKAEPLMLEAKAITEKVLGKEHPIHATSLSNLASIYESMADYTKAEPLYLEATAIREKVLGKEHPSYANSLNTLAGLYYSMGDHTKAVQLYLEAKAITEKVFGKEHPSYAFSLSTLAGLYYSMADYTKAEPLYLEAKAITEKGFGKEHPSYATSLNNLAGLYESMAEYTKAEPLYLEAKAILEKVLGKEHFNYATVLNNLAGLYQSMADYTKAEPLLLEAKAIQERVLGKEHPEYARVLNNLASLYQSMADYTKAEPLLLEAKAILERVRGKEHPDYASSLNCLAALYKSMADYARAEPLLLEAISIQEKVLGKLHPDYAASLNNLAGLYQSMADYTKAEPLLLEAKAIREKALGKEHREYATSLNNLALLYESMTDYAKAEPLYLEAKTIDEKVLGKEHPDYAASLNNLAMLYESMADYAKAEPLLLEAKVIREKRLGKEHPDYTQSLNNLALLYFKMADYAKAESLNLEAKVIRAKVLGKVHPDYATSLNNLAGLYHSMEDYSKAEPLYGEALAIREKVLGNQHPDFAQSLNNLAWLYTSMANCAKAEPLYEKCLSLASNHLEATAAIQSERQQIVMEQSLRKYLNGYLSMALVAPKVPSSAVGNSILRKGSVMRRLRGLRVAADDPAISEQFSELQSITAQYSKLSQQTPAPEHAAAWREKVAELNTKRETLEQQLIRSSSAFAGAVKPITIADIQQSLPGGSVLVDYLEFNSKDGRKILASLIRPSGESTMIDLGSARDLSKQINQWLESYATSAEGQAAGLAIRKQIWEPLEKHFSDAKFILVSPDGALGRLPLAALPGKQPGSYLIEEYPIALIPVPQLLPDLMQEQPSTAQYQLLALGDIDYDNAPTPAKLDQQPANYPDASSSLLLALRGRGQLPDTLRSSGGTWSKLAGTGPEVNYITQLYQRQHQAPNTSVVKLDATSASETAFRELAPQSRVIHVATHGFFASPDKKSALSGESIEAAAKQQMFTSIGDNQRLTVQGFSPGQLSGLVFAGANLRTSDFSLQTSPPLTPDPTPRSGARGVDIGSDDGILTADEIAFMRLENCELVVLSACETNVGAVAGGEGILGLQRAFQQAGARSTISSLWKVDDDATKTLMQLFYTNVWTHKQSKLEALRNAQLEMLNHYNEATQKLDRSAPVEMKLVPKKDSKSTATTDGTKRLSPKYWAAFQLSGDWR